MRTIVEIGPGRGDFLFHLAETNPNAGIIGIEIKTRRYLKLVERVAKLGLKNIRIIQADARLAAESLFEPESVDEIHINFPDPWPKRRHKKHRLINESFVRDCSVILARDGTISFMTDALSYAEDAKMTFEKEPTLLLNEILFPVSDEAGLFPTLFMQKWKKEGRKIYVMRWGKSAPAS